MLVVPGAETGEKASGETFVNIYLVESSTGSERGPGGDGGLRWPRELLLVLTTD